MTTPNFLSDSRHDPGDATIVISDVETGGVGIISTLRTNLLARGWTEIATGLFQSPAMPGGLWFKFLAQRIDADTIEFWVWNHLDVPVFGAAGAAARRIDINAGATTVEFYFGKYYVGVLSRRTPTPEVFYASLLEVEPDVDGSLANAVVAYCFRSAAGTAATFNAGFWYAIDNNAGSASQRLRRCATDMQGADRELISHTGRLLYFPAEMGINYATVVRFVGQMPMMLVGDHNIAFDSLKKPGVDGATGKVYRVLPFPALARHVLLVRKPSADGTI